MFNRTMQQNTTFLQPPYLVLSLRYSDYKEESYSSLATARQEFKGAHKKTIRLPKFSSRFISSKIESLL